MKYSVQQIKFEFFAYMKGLDPEFRNWSIGVSDDPLAEMRCLPGADPEQDPWIFKPAVSGIAATNIRNYFVRQLGCLAARPDGDLTSGSQVYAIRRAGRLVARSAADADG